MNTLNISDSKESPHSAHQVQCDKCHRANCSSLHTYSASVDCALWTEVGKAGEEQSPLQKRQLDLVRAINRLSFINRLPLEMITQILILSTKFNDVSCTTLSGRSYRWSPPLLLGAVCREWREITLATPQLWTTVTIQPYRDSAHIHIVNEWLQRSGARPLTITLTSPYDIAQEPFADLQPILGVLRFHSVRWKSVTFNNLPKMVLHDLLDNLEDTAQVETLRIDCGQRIWHRRKEISIRMPFCPKIFHGINMDQTAGALCSTTFCRWDNLTHLDVQKLNFVDLIHIIRNAIKIKRCVVKYPTSPWEKYDERRPPSKPVINRSLIHLDIQLFCANEFLQHITLPSLHTLECHHGFSLINEMHINTLDNFIVRSQAPLRGVVFHVCVGVRQYIPTIGFWDPRLPNITYLKLTVSIQNKNDSTAAMDEILALFACSRDQIVLPSLQVFELTTVYMMTTSWSHFINMFHKFTDDVHDGGPPTNSADTNLPLFSGTHLGPGPLRRPLSKACIRLIANAFIALEDQITMGAHHYLCLLDIQRSGVELEITGKDGADLLQSDSSELRL
ncbi:hypothetical protein CVT25_001756 [Psilocybe cyanescens]|uniref:Uncharacterized protein n=1 Tax=Psilocybe cyanescens TaxID=93625 RepID=A0A409WPR6_PSICY|nr:hypothetical protein CVT25_001756 [Psilocybe cyanescens]